MPETAFKRELKKWRIDPLKYILMNIRRDAGYYIFHVKRVVDRMARHDAALRREHALVQRYINGKLGRA